MAWETDMQKALVALVMVGAGFSASRASAEGIEADVEVYGTLVPHLEYMETEGATPLGERGGATQVPDAAFTAINEPPRFRLTQGTSNLGFRGTVDLAGDALKVV